MQEPERITPEAIYDKVKSGEALLVCAYDDMEKFKKTQIKGGISFEEFKGKVPSLPKGQEIIFYCA